MFPRAQAAPHKAVDYWNVCRAATLRGAWALDSRRLEITLLIITNTEDIDA